MTRSWREWLVRQISLAGDFDERILNAFLKVPREVFSEFHYDLDVVYSDNVIVTAKDGDSYSTSSQPSLMALFMSVAGLKESMKVLEIGSGTGYNACVMAHVVGENGLVVGIESNQKFFKKSVEVVSKLGIQNVIFVNEDGFYGFEKFAPYDAIVVTVAVDRISRHWIEQLRIGGRIVGPIDVYTIDRQPAFVFEKTSDSIVAKHLVETKFIKAGGLLGNLNETNLKRLSKIEKTFSAPVEFLSVPASSYEAVGVFHVASWSLCERSGWIYFVEDEGFARWKSGWELFGRMELIKNIAGEWAKTGFIPITLLKFRYDHRMNFRGVERWDET
ncbi:MAG: Protein-L-isoaspartate(D-aspartate) O-methyltransferase [Thermotoga sp. 50_1627]|uniref:protein-L-isoaspartate O-methyltransferase n=1 Tax=Pseudothermotoga sp. TaxID=2033661 RepID=UPI00076DE17C|nr:MAG: Protein-L-isoaspartate(D-aspartate) O-methyltransferase [Thermotoga sp. 50_64]KUK25781.1 MAG: Protein-L-isoaspartate(D-aspartate) O-methyltransferase [Thermotoga sp. 50_1627]MBC7115465.1 protein-L-isoaspartate O-methyltransferase [Pseudothermotoga sp.]MDK2922854.1 protein-L-isoaspartate(D-aspartate) O-methyltransferase [Pseudothermotoga sp.]HBT40117.1 protein-L-isoaspartate O-methyltransferase [Pseudothermotoga sp.]